mmetsp:Transcript_7887/g.18149  ORF Transcript_7887/g.18149 Transcript_7887/m.18149 type:complete len:286 (-) Transcript_7887:138-995(-)
MSCSCTLADEAVEQHACLQPVLVPGVRAVPLEILPQRSQVRPVHVHLGSEYPTGRMVYYPLRDLLDLQHVLERRGVLVLAVDRHGEELYPVSRDGGGGGGGLGYSGGEPLPGDVGRPAHLAPRRGEAYDVKLVGRLQDVTVVVVDRVELYDRGGPGSAGLDLGRPSEGCLAGLGSLKLGGLRCVVDLIGRWSLMSVGTVGLESWRRRLEEDGQAGPVGGDDLVVGRRHVLPLFLLVSLLRLLLGYHLGNDVHSSVVLVAQRCRADTLAARRAVVDFVRRHGADCK